MLHKTQKQVVYVMGLKRECATEERLRSRELFGRFGAIRQVAVNKNPIFSKGLGADGTGMVGGNNNGKGGDNSGNSADATWASGGASICRFCSTRRFFFWRVQLRNDMFDKKYKLEGAFLKGICGNSRPSGEGLPFANVKSPCSRQPFRDKVGTTRQ